MERFNSNNFLNQFCLNEFINMEKVGSIVVTNSISNLTYTSKKLKILFNFQLSEFHKNFKYEKTHILDRLKKLEFSHHVYMPRILLSFIHEDYLIYLSDVFDDLEWITLDKYILKNKVLEENEIKEITLRLFEVLKYFNEKRVYHYQLHPRNIYLKPGKNFDIKVNILSLLYYSHCYLLYLLLN